MERALFLVAARLFLVLLESKTRSLSDAFDFEPKPFPVPSLLSGAAAVAPSLFPVLRLLPFASRAANNLSDSEASCGKSMGLKVISEPWLVLMLLLLPMLVLVLELLLVLALLLKERP